MFKQMQSKILLRSPRPRSKCSKRPPVASGSAPMTPSTASGSCSSSSPPLIVRSQPSTVPIANGSWSVRVKLQRKAGERPCDSPAKSSADGMSRRLPRKRSPAVAHQPIPRRYPALATVQDQRYAHQSPGRAQLQIVSLQESIKFGKERQLAVRVSQARPTRHSCWLGVLAQHERIPQTNEPRSEP